MELALELQSSFQLQTSDLVMDLTLLPKRAGTSILQSVKDLFQMGFALVLYLMAIGLYTMT